MSIRGNDRRYGLVAQAFHWITVVLILWTWLIAGTWERGGQSSPILALHETLGFTVFCLVLLRLLWRFFDHRPVEPPMPGIMAAASKLVHWLLYALMVAIPTSAIVGSWLEGHSITVYGVGVGPFLTTSRSTGHQILEIHQLLGTTIIWVAGCHAAAAIFHHVILKDRVLRQMLPVG